LASSIDTSSIRISSAERNTISVALAWSSWRRCGSVSDANVRLLARRRISNISSVSPHFNKVVVEAGSCIVVLNEVHGSLANSKDSVHFRGNIDIDGGLRARIVCIHRSNVQRRSYSRWLVIVACSRNRGGIHGAGYKIGIVTSGVERSFREGGGGHGGTGRNAR